MGVGGDEACDIVRSAGSGGACDDWRQAMMQEQVATKPA